MKKNERLSPRLEENRFATAMISEMKSLLVKNRRMSLCAAFFILHFSFLLSSVQAQTFVRGCCTPDVTVDDAALARGLSRRQLPAIKRDWNPDRIYRQLVVLVSFSDTDFQMERPRETYDSIFNVAGYNQRFGPGCVADYFRDQSNGMFNLKFDVFGPYKVESKAQPYDEPDANTRNYGKNSLSEAMQMMITENQNLDFSPYDWNDIGKINQVIFVFAGCAGNAGVGTYGHIWPNTSSFSTVTTPDGKRISDYTCSGELWTSSYLYSCGIGTICHEYTHSLGLPDIYPTANNVGFSVCDEWDLMDGGNFTNFGWCPPNYTPMEKMLLGWLDFTDLTEPVTITGLKPSAAGGKVYRIKHSESEWLLLENRQNQGWDKGAPGRGLVIYHVNYDKSVWGGNTVNNNQNRRRFELVNADNRDYDAWDLITTEQRKTWRNSSRMNNYHLSGSPYPWTSESDSTIHNEELTDSSVPPAKMHYPNLEGSMTFGKPITNIRMSDDGLISFDFMGGGNVGIRDTKVAAMPKRVYDLSGHLRTTAIGKGLFIVKDADGTVRKVLR